MSGLLELETRPVDCVVCGGPVDQPVDIMGALAAAPPSTAEALRGSGHGGEDGWTPREVAAHLADLEVYRGWRIRKVLAEEEPLIDPIDQDLWASGLHYGDRDVETSIETFAANRHANIELLGRAGESVLKRRYRTSEFGPISLRHLLAHTTHHDRAHLRQILGT